MIEMDDIIESIYNGQRRQAVAQVDTSSITFDELFEELIDRDMLNEIVTIFRIAQSMNVIKVRN